MLIFKNNTWVRLNRDIREIVYVDQHYIEFGFFDTTVDNLPIYYKGQIYWLQNKEQCKVPLYWRNDLGCYTFDEERANNIKRVSKCIWNYPIPKFYNFSKLNLKSPTYHVAVDNDYDTISDFTIGLEYETCRGNIPWEECQKVGLVPLYDGSIDGHEYVTFPLNNDQFSIVEQQLKIIQQYTEFNENCSLHIHFGNFPINYDKINNLVKCWKTFQNDLLRYLPAWSYEVERYKVNGKAYNKPLNVDDLNQFYEDTTGNIYEDDLSFYWTNKYDEEEYRKWEVHGRYYNLNIMHLISGDSHKTVEFRFLRPTYNYSEIKWFIMVFGGYLKYIKESEKPDEILTVKKIITTIYPKQIANKLLDIGDTLIKLSKFQTNCGDCGGINQYLKKLFVAVFPINI